MALYVSVRGLVRVAMVEGGQCRSRALPPLAIDVA